MKYKDVAGYPLSQDQIDQLNSIIRGYDPYHVRIRAQAILLLFADCRSFDELRVFAGYTSILSTTGRNGG